MSSFGRTYWRTRSRDLVSPHLPFTATLMERPDFIKALLRNVGSEVDPVRLVRRIRNGLRIPGLKRALIEILQDFNLQASALWPAAVRTLTTDASQLALVTGCHVVVAQETLALSTTLRAGMSRGVLVAGTSSALRRRHQLSRTHRPIGLRVVPRPSCPPSLGFAHPWTSDTPFVPAGADESPHEGIKGRGAGCRSVTGAMLDHPLIKEEGNVGVAHAPDVRASD